MIASVEDRTVAIFVSSIDVGAVLDQVVEHCSFFVLWETFYEMAKFCPSILSSAVQSDFAFLNQEFDPFKSFLDVGEDDVNQVGAHVIRDLILLLLFWPFGFSRTESAHHSDSLTESKIWLIVFLIFRFFFNYRLLRDELEIRTFFQKNIEHVKSFMEFVLQFGFGFCLCRIPFSKR